MKPLISFSKAQYIDTVSQKKYNIPSTILMEQAGIQCADVLFSDISIKSIARKMCKIIAVCGSGNNGGDAQVLIREAFYKGYSVEVYFLTRPKSKLSKIQYEILKALGVPIYMKCASFMQKISRLTKNDYIIDGITGVGLSVKYKHPVIIYAINKSKATVISVDVPSGLPESYIDMAPIVKADITVSMGSRKFSMYHPQYREYSGTIVDVNPAFPPQVYEELLKSTNSFLLELSDIEVMEPIFSPNTYKHERGVVALAVGNEESYGAAILALRAASKGYAGLVYGLVNDSIKDSISRACPSAIIHSSFEVLEKSIQKIHSFVVGCGWGKHLIGDILKILSYNKVTVFDADALRICASADERDQKKVKKHHTLFTPHVGELQDLWKNMPACEKSDGGKNRFFAMADDVASYYKNIVIAKNSVTYISCGRDSISFIIDGQTPLLATAGSGDVLAGLIGSIVAHTQSKFSRENKKISFMHMQENFQKAAALGVLIHAESGKYLSRMHTTANAEDIVQAISSLSKRL